MSKSLSSAWPTLESVKKTVKNQKEGKNKPAVKYPLKTTINAYGFLYFSNSWLSDLGWAKGTAVTIEKSPDGSIIVKKAENNA